MGKVKSTVTENVTKKESEFPKLMKSNDTELIVLMIGIGEGIVLKEAKHYEIGFFSNTWIIDKFSDYDGEITLKNE